jgi:hypothetical protein
LKEPTGRFKRRASRFMHVRKSKLNQRPIQKH